MQTIGRYQLQKKVGAGSQGVVYLCLDPKLQRQVAIKLVTRTLFGSDAQAAAFDHEAKAMGRFQHQNIVTVYDVGTLKQRPYIVFEYVSGQVLSDMLKNGPLKLSQAVELFAGAVSGMSEAHAAGIIHRDLKPANIMVSGNGVAKIMDFGIAQLANAGSGAESQLVGTPRYMAPEYIRDRQVSPRMDVFALGAVLYEMLTGRPAFGGKSTSDVLARILMGPPKKPSSFNSSIDDVLEGLCLKALAANPGDRFADAGQLLGAIKEYQRQQSTDDTGERSGNSTVDFLYRRMQRRADFPALADSIRTLNQLGADTDKDAEKLASIIVRDFALTNKILKAVNSAYYGSFSGKIGTISRAIVVLGIDAIRSLAASLIFFEHLSNQTTASRLKHQMASALHRALLAREIAARAEMRDVEEAFVCAMFNELGQVLVSYYLPDEDQEIERLTQDGTALSEAARQVLGVGFDEVGQVVARQWNFPRTITYAMKPLKPGRVDAATTDEDQLRVVAHCAGEISRSVVAEDASAQMKETLNRYRKALGIDKKTAESIVENAGEEFGKLASKLIAANPNDDVLTRMRGKREEQPADETQAAAEATVEVSANSSAVAAEDPTLATGQIAPPDMDGILTEGLQEATNILLESGNVGQLINIVLESLYRAMGFRRVLLALRQRDGSYGGRMGFGADISEWQGKFNFSSSAGRNIFSAAVLKNVDVYIADVHDPKIRDDLPDWYFKLTDAGSFLLFPVQVGKQPFGVIYGEFAMAEQVEVSTKTFNLIKSLRNQMILALRQQ